MKKLFICLLIIVVSGQMHCQTLDKVISDFSRVENVEKVSIGKFGWNFLKFASIGNKDLAIMKKISSIQVIDLSECSEDAKRQFSQEIGKINDSNYELMLRVKDDEDEILIFSKIQKEKIRELIIVDKNDPAIVRLKGKFDFNDISSASSLKKIQL